MATGAVDGFNAYKNCSRRGPAERFRLRAERARADDGRGAANDVRIKDSSASRQHCVLRRDADGWRVLDLGSRHGTLVNGVPCSDEPLRNDDQLGIGRSAFVFFSPHDAESEATVSIEVGDDATHSGATRDVR